MDNIVTRENLDNHRSVITDTIAISIVKFSASDVKRGQHIHLHAPNPLRDTTQTPLSIDLPHSPLSSSKGNILIAIVNSIGRSPNDTL
jgi:hypothetical protein